jgi:biopolymer transport protein ExbB/TolQ
MPERDCSNRGEWIVEKTTRVKLSWAREDVEQRFGIPGGQHTQVNTIFSAGVGILLTLGFFGILLVLRDSAFAKMFIERGMNVPYFIAFLSFWSLAFLYLKWRKLVFQRKALQYVVVPQDPDFVLSSSTVNEVINEIYTTVDDPRYFVLFNRVLIALANLRNLGRVADLDDILRSQAEQDESAMETSYAVVRSFVWAIPVLGFIGTVLGLSRAIGGFTGVLQAADDLSQIKSALEVVTDGLSTAFETTLQGLVAALLIQLFLAFLKKSEEEFLDSCSDYCLRHIVNRLRIMPYEHAIE